MSQAELRVPCRHGRQTCVTPAPHSDSLICYAGQAEAGSEEYGGPKPFSEPESRVVRLVAETARPQAYVALHSGEYALYAPWDSEARPAWLWFGAQGLGLRISSCSAHALGEYALYAPWDSEARPAWLWFMLFAAPQRQPCSRRALVRTVSKCRESTSLPERASVPPSRTHGTGGVGPGPA